MALERVHAVRNGGKRGNAGKLRDAHADVRGKTKRAKRGAAVTDSH